jgi:CRP-like cAMP-binding protein
MRHAALLLREGYSYQNLVESLGTHRETVSSIMGKFRGQGLISTESRRICLPEAERLRAIAEPA